MVELCLLSIVVPVYNVEDHIEKCLESLVNQTLEDCEIILVNDGSTDNSDKIIEKYKNKYNDKIVSLKKKNGGLSDARNYGLKFSRGQYVGFVDSDDWIEPNMFKDMYKYAEEKDADIVLTDFIFEPKGIVEKSNIQTDLALCLNRNPELLFTQPSVCNKLFKRSLFKENNISFPFGLLHEDRVTITQLYSLSNKIYYMGKAYYHYLKHRDNSITTSVNLKKYQDIIVVLKKMEDHLKGIDSDKSVIETFNALIIDLYISFSINAIFEIKDAKVRDKFLKEFRTYTLDRNERILINKSFRSLSVKRKLILSFLLIRWNYVLKILKTTLR